MKTVVMSLLLLWSMSQGALAEAQRRRVVDGYATGIVEGLTQTWPQRSWTPQSQQEGRLDLQCFDDCQRRYQRGLCLKVCTY